ncbi:MAG: phage portal protein [Firmicutes bacterium]|nr:phage portal protein [Bacillota bacterium]
MDGYIQLWSQLYRGISETYDIHNGLKRITRKIKNMNLAKSVSESWANVLFNMRVQIAIDDEHTKKFVFDTFDDNNLWVRLNEFQEYKAAYGTVCYIPYAANVESKTISTIKDNEEKLEALEIESAEKIKLTYVTAENIIPLTYENGIITELAITSSKSIADRAFVILQMFVLDDESEYVIVNRIFAVDKTSGKLNEITTDDIGTGYFNAVVENLGLLPAPIRTGSKTKPFIIDRMNISNNLVKDSPLGIAVFSNAIDTMRICNVIFDSYENEFWLGKKRVFVAEGAVKLEIDGQPQIDPDDVIFYTLHQENKDGTELIKELNMELRIPQHEMGLQQQLNIFTSQCGLGENFYKYQAGRSIGYQNEVAIITENSQMFRSLKKHEIILEAVLVDLIRLIIEIGKRTIDDSLVEDTEIKIQFDDSLIDDKNAEKELDLKELEKGIITPIQYRMKWYGETEEEAEYNLRNSDAVFKRLLTLLEVGIISPVEFRIKWFTETEQEAQNAIEKQLLYDTRDIQT